VRRHILPATFPDDAGSREAGIRAAREALYSRAGGAEALRFNRLLINAGLIKGL
jgi:hypothetical protein